MTPRLIIIRPDGECISEPIGEPPTTDYLRRLVDGWIKAVPMFHSFHDQPCIAYRNEDGEKMRLEPNMTATKAWMIAFEGASEILLGTVVVIVGSREFLETV